jgi:hypothetical protein
MYSNESGKRICEETEVLRVIDPLSKCEYPKVARLPGVPVSENEFCEETLNASVINHRSSIPSKWE